MEITPEFIEQLYDKTMRNAQATLTSEETDKALEVGGSIALQMTLLSMAQDDFWGENFSQDNLAKLSELYGDAAGQ